LSLTDGFLKIEIHRLTVTVSDIYSECLQCSHYEEKLKTIKGNANAVSPAKRQQVTYFHYVTPIMNYVDVVKIADNVLQIL